VSPAFGRKEVLAQVSDSTGAVRGWDERAERLAAMTKETTVTQYMMSVHSVEGDVTPTDDDMQRMYAQVDVFNDKLVTAGTWVFGGGLEPIEAARTVDATGAEPIISDGPFAEAKEWIGGFWVIEAPDLDAALALAVEASTACEGKVEVRPFQSM
jgi:hypothetical protein